MNSHSCIKHLDWNKGLQWRFPSVGQASVGLERVAMLGHGILAAGKKYSITRILQIYMTKDP